MQNDLHFLDEIRSRLESHPVYDAVRSIEDLRIFMRHHVYSVWDFMSVVKYLQNEVAPSTYPWSPLGDPEVRYFINQLVLEEESDVSFDGSHASHFELYCGAMNEMGEDPSGAAEFARMASDQGMERALGLEYAPEPSCRFMESTFRFVASGQPHKVAAAFALGREHVIPSMFRAFLARTGVSEHDAPVFHYYLRRHIHLDEDFHGPISLKLLENLCNGNPEKEREALAAGREALEARIRFWDGINEAIAANRS